MRVRELRLTYHPIPGTADIGTGEPLTPASARTLARRCLAGEAQEVFLAILLDAKHRPLAVQIVARGTLSTCEVHPREVLKGAVLANAYAVITAHNHPSGDPTPSPDDLACWGRLNQAGAILGISFLDHVVIGDEGREYSHRERGGM